MIEVFTWIQVAVAVSAGLLCLVLGFAGKTPADLTLGSVALVELLVVQLFIALFAPAFGNVATGSVLEFYTYLISALLIPPAAAVWALVERSKWSTVILGVAALSIAVMVYRMQQIWLYQVA
jgi:membrane-bound ClpP family serine protease